MFGQNWVQKIALEMKLKLFGKKGKTLRFISAKSMHNIELTSFISIRLSAFTLSGCLPDFSKTFLASKTD